MRFLPALLLFACADRYLCGPGTVVEGEWCVREEEAGGDSDSTAGIDTADTFDTAETGDTSETGDTGDTEPSPPRVVINEYMASNDEKAADELGEFDDWVEVYNAGGRQADLSEISLTDDSEVPGLYRFPAGSTLAPGAFVVVWADGTPEQGDYHAAFTLQSAGDRIVAIRDPDGAAVVLDDVSYTEMLAEVSAARFPDGSDTWVTTENVTPGTANEE